MTPSGIEPATFELDLFSHNSNFMLQITQPIQIYNQICKINFINSCPLGGCLNTQFGIKRILHYACVPRTALPLCSSVDKHTTRLYPSPAIWHQVHD
jgi:hypothetical protein